MAQYCGVRPQRGLRSFARTLGSFSVTLRKRPEVERLSEDRVAVLLSPQIYLISDKEERRPERLRVVVGKAAILF